VDLDLKGNTALITGGSRGIGRAVAHALAAEGCDLVLTARSAADLEATRAAITKQYSVSVRTIAADLADSATVARLAKEAPAIDVLVNNAGAIPGGSLTAVDELAWRSAWDLKVFGTINMTRAYYPLMKARGGGVIVNVIGNAALTRDPASICVVTANAGLTAFTQSLGSTSLNDGIRVNAVSPGPIATDRQIVRNSKKALEQFGDANRWPEYFKSLPGGRIGEPDEVAAMIVFLASPRSDYTSGAVITIDAGVSSRSGPA
jgi:3-oxoacyl-[acyl-carrier protein] reductase